MRAVGYMLAGGVPTGSPDEASSFSVVEELGFGVVARGVATSVFGQGIDCLERLRTFLTNQAISSTGTM